MLLLGIDVGTSSIKVSVVEADTHTCVASAQFPETESPIISTKPGWAEQSPDAWWKDVQTAIRKAHASGKYDPSKIVAIGIAYQMHGLVLVDKDQLPIRNSIIWCDSRAVETGEKAFQTIGESKCLSRLLNSPGNFTASKLAWVKKNEPEHYKRIHKIMLPGDFIAMKLTGKMNTSVSALSEGVFWDFMSEELSKDVFDYFDFDKQLIPSIEPVFANHGELTADAAKALALTKGIPVTYKAGDQPNNALSLNVMEPGEVAATAGTSGVIYGVTDSLFFDKQSRVNSFAHVNYESGKKRLGVLLCINGTGIMNSWMKNTIAPDKNYKEIDAQARSIPEGSNGLTVLPFGNGAERMLGNKMIGAHLHHINLNIHTPAHIFRAVQEGIAFAFRYGLDIMRENGMNPKVIRAGRANLFFSDVFIEAFVNATNTPLELYSSDGSVGAAVGAGLGAGIYSGQQDAFTKMKPLKLIEPTKASLYDSLYQQWESDLKMHLENSHQ
jgi:xylulokinase